MWSTRNKETRTRNKKSNYCGLGLFLIILGGIFIAVPIPYLGVGSTLSAFLIVIGVILLLVSASSKSRGHDKSLKTTASIMKEKEYCPKCGARRYSRFTTKCVTCGYDFIKERNHCPKCGALIYSRYSRKCVLCGYIFISDSRQVPTISDKKVEEPKKSSDVQLFPPISDLLQVKETSKPITNVSELKTEEKQTAPSTSEKKIEKLFTTCPRCRQKLPLGAKFCAKCGQKVEVIKPAPLISDIGETDLNWLKHQYYDLGRSIQDIANELGVSMIRIRKMLNRIEIILEKEKSMIDVPPLKAEEAQPLTPVSDIGEETPKIIPPEEPHPIPPISELLQEEKTSKSITDFRDRYRTGVGIACPRCSQKLPLGAKFCAICGQKIEEPELTQPTSDIKEEIPKLAPFEEVQPAPPILEKMEKKSRIKPRICEFCGMRIPKNKSFCLQCGMIIKIT